jgi:hypothetical protein
VTEHLRTVLWLTEQFLPIQHEIVALQSGSEVRLTGVGKRHGPG